MFSSKIEELGQTPPSCRVKWSQAAKTRVLSHRGVFVQYKTSRAGSVPPFPCPVKSGGLRAWLKKAQDILTVGAGRTCCKTVPAGWDQSIPRGVTDSPKNEQADWRTWRCVSFLPLPAAIPNPSQNQLVSAQKIAFWYPFQSLYFYRSYLKHCKFLLSRFSFCLPGENRWYWA